MTTLTRHDVAETFNTAGLAPEDDLALTGPHPEDPEASETFAVWLYDGERDLGMTLRIHPDRGIASGWATLFLPGGRIVNAEPEQAPFDRPDQPETEHVKYRCVEPFRRWTYRLVDLPVAETTDEAMASGEVVWGEPTTTVSLELDGTTVAPAWIQGSLLPEAAKAMEQRVGLWIAGRLNAGMSRTAFRYDQALSARGTVRVGDETFEFHGHGLRGHVRGVRRLDGFKSHTWVGAVFPASGRAVGLQCHIGHDTPGGYEFSESYVYQDGQLHATRAIYAPPVSRDDPHAPFVIEVACDALGLTRITGHDARVQWISMGALGLGTPAPDTMRRLGRVADAPTAMSQAVSCFDWDGDPGYGVVERSG